MVDLLVRGADIAEAEMLPEIERSAGEAFRKIPDLEWIAEGDDRSAEWHRRLIAQGACLVAVNGDNRLVGFLSAEVLSSDLHIWELSVVHDLQRSGIGRRLIETAIDMARMQKLGSVTLTTFRHVIWNEQFYTRLGFIAFKPGSAGPRLEGLLSMEVAVGLPEHRRCAMRLPISQSQGQPHKTRPPALCRDMSEPTQSFLNLGLDQVTRDSLRNSASWSASSPGSKAEL